MSLDDLNGLQWFGLVMVVAGPLLMLFAANFQPQADDTKAIVNKIVWRWDGLAMTVGGLVMLVRGDEFALYFAVACIAVSAVPAIMEALRKQRELGKSGNKDDK